MNRVLKRPMFRRGGEVLDEGIATSRMNYDVGGITAEDIQTQLEMLKGVMPQPKDGRLLRYLSRATGQLGDPRNQGGTGLQRIVRAMSGDPLEKLYQETDARSKYDQGLQSLALKQALSEKERERKLFDEDRKRTLDDQSELDMYRSKKEIDEEFRELNPDADRTANQIDFEYVKEDLEKRGLPVYNDDGSLSEDFKRSFYFYKTGKTLVEETNEDFGMANISGDSRDMDAAIANNQMQRIKQFHYDRALKAGIDLATVDVYDPTEGLDNFVLYIAEDGVQRGVPDPNDPEKTIMKNIPGAAYVQRIGDQVKFYDINFQEIMTE